MLSITNLVALATSATVPGDPQLGKFLETLENALTKGDSKSFSALLHPSILKTSEEKHAVFSALLDSYEIKGKKLQRSTLYELNITENRPITQCRNHTVTAVVGPKRQWAIEYAFTNAGEQARLFFLIGTVPPALAKHKKMEMPTPNANLPVGIVHVHSQNWSFGGQTPETLFAESRKWALLDEPIAAWAYATAAKRVVQGNGYFLDRRYTQNLADYEAIDTKFATVMAPHLNKQEPGTTMTTRAFTTVFKEKQPEIGVKVELPEELPVNQQIAQCKTLIRNLAPVFVGARRVLSGMECMLFRKGEPLEQLPGYGTIFVSFADALKG